MSKSFKVYYTLVHKGGSKLTQSTTLLMESASSYEAESKIRRTGNIMSNVERIVIDRITS